MSVFTKAYQAIEASLDNVIAKAQTSAAQATSPQAPETRTEHIDNDRKGFIEMDIPVNDQGIFRERLSATTTLALKNMSRRDSMIVAIHQCLINQVSNFTQPQVDKYSPGYRFRAKKPADLSREEKLSLSDPDLDEESYKALKYELETKRSKLQDEQDKDVEKLATFIQHCGSEKTDTNTSYKRMDFDKFVKLIVRDRLTYNYVAAELIPNKGGDSITSFYPVSAGTIRYVAARDKAQYKIVEPYLKQFMKDHTSEASESKPFRYAQVLRGKPVAAWNEDDFIFEAANPSIDPEDYGYAQGELEWLVGIVTNHLYAENHNRNFFVNGTTKGLLHIKGDNINRAQLEAFKRNWFAQLSGSNNSFRPPIIGMADDVKWVPLTQTNSEMEFQEWMQYLIKMGCAFYQIDPAEINFDITKSNSGTLNEASNEQRIKSSKNKGLRPLLMFIQNIINNQILPRYNKALSDKYIFEFVGLEAETKQQEIERFQKETQVYRTLNEVRNEQGLAPLEYGDIVLAATYTQYVQMQEQALAAANQPVPGTDPNNPDDPGADQGAGNDQLTDEDVPQDGSDVDDDVDTLLAMLDEPAEKDDKPDPKADDKGDKPDVKKAMTVEYHHYIKDDK